MSEFVISIARADGGKVLLKPGGSGERDLIARVRDAVVSKGVGVFKTEQQVMIAVEDGMREVLRDLKSEVVPR